MGDDDVGMDEIEAVLKRIQRFDPVGVAAKDLRDCLLIQLSQFDKATPWLEEARLIISDHLDLLANHDFRTLMRVTRLKEDVLKEAVNLIQSPTPDPGSLSRPGSQNTLFRMYWCVSITIAGWSNSTATAFHGCRLTSTTPPCATARATTLTASLFVAICRMQSG